MTAKLPYKQVFTGVSFSIPFILILSTVFVVSNEMANGVVTGKQVWFYAAMGITGIITLAGTILCRNKFRFSLTDILVLCFAGSVLLSSVVFNPASQNTTKIVLFVLLIVWYFCFRLIVIPFNLKNALFIFFIITGLVEAVWGLMQLYGFSHSQHSLFKITGSFFNPGPYAGYLAVIFPMSLYFWVQGTRCRVHGKYLVPCTLRLVPFLSLLACIAILLVLPAAMSRASWLAVAAGSLVVMGGHYSGWLLPYIRKDRKKFLIGGMGIIFLCCMAFIGMYLLKKDSADGRLLTWKISLQTVLKHPLGVGLGYFSGAYGDTQADYFAGEKASETEKFVAGNPEYAFNEYLQILIESGILSFVLFMAMLAVAFREKIQQQEWGSLGSLTALAVFACFSYPFSVLPFLIVLALLLAAPGDQVYHTGNEPKRYPFGILSIRNLLRNPVVLPDKRISHLQCL